MLDNLIRNGFQILAISHARAILTTDFPQALAELEEALTNFSIAMSEIIGSGGGVTKGTQRLRKALARHGWTKFKFEIKKIINGDERESISHEVDHVRNFELEGRKHRLALELEWNNKDPFFDRDLENFKRLHAEGAISVGMLITRGTSLQDNMRDMVNRFVNTHAISRFEDLKSFDVRTTDTQREAVLKAVNRGKSFQDAWTDKFVSDKFGQSTTHWRKLMDRVDRGVGNPCPLLLIGLPDSVVRLEDQEPASNRA